MDPTLKEVWPIEPQSTPRVLIVVEGRNKRHVSVEVASESLASQMMLEHLGNLYCPILLRCIVTSLHPLRSKSMGIALLVPDCHSPISGSQIDTLA